VRWLFQKLIEQTTFTRGVVGKRSFKEKGQKRSEIFFVEEQGEKKEKDKQ